LKRDTMAISRQDLSILLFYFLGYSRIRNLVLHLQRRPVARFVTFHDILPCTLKQFEAKLHFLKRSTNVVSLDDFFAGKLSSKRINVVITFDDGYKSWVTHAVPILNKLELPAVFFIASGFIGLSKEDETEFAQSKLFAKLGLFKMTGCLDYKDVKKISERGFTVGGHTISHCNLADLRNEGRIRQEIVEDKMRLETITGSNIIYFAYPFGAYNNPKLNLSKILRESGYRGAVTTTPNFNSVESDPYMLHREMTHAAMHPCVFKARVYGNGDATRYLKVLVRAVHRQRWISGPR
jgi:peptidoglycan/xylan/chitin deacetylase (PgdA/CDA1 family)